MEKWFSVSQKMPQPDEEVWIQCFNYGEGGCTYKTKGYCDHEGNWHSTGYYSVGGTIIRWAPLSIDPPPIPIPKIPKVDWKNSAE